MVAIVKCLFYEGWFQQCKMLTRDAKRMPNLESPVQIVMIDRT